MPRAAAGHGGARLKLHRSALFGEVSNQPVLPENRAIAPVPGTGTSFAIDYLRLGGAVDSARSIGRGGARNRADRVSHELTAAQIANLRAAECHAEAIGLPFNRMITIHWQAAGVPLEGMAKATGRFLDLLTRALARHGGATAWLWVHEGGERKGGHCHLLAHVPPDLVRVITRLQRGWLRRITGSAYRKRVIRSNPIGGRLGLETGNPGLHAVNVSEALSYVMKGAGPVAAARLDLERLEPGGRVIGKRCGTSQNIGAKARSKGMKP